MILQNLASDYSKYWLLDPDIIFLNHGSFGACPSPVLEKQAFYRELLEKEPVRFFMRQYEDLYFNALRVLAEFISADVHNIAFVPNVTTAVNAVLRSLQFDPGDELLTTNHVYPACKNILDFIAQQTGAEVIYAEFNFPIKSSGVIADAILSKVTSRTRIALIDHITSPTGLILPIEKIVSELSNLEVDTIVDGAHAVGSIPLNVESIGAAYYTANCHKWLCAPKGSAFLYVRPDKQELIHPAIISHPHVSHPSNPHTRFESEFYWTGTADFSAYLCVPEAIDFMGSLISGGWKELMKRNHNLALQAGKMISRSLNMAPPCPENMISSLCSFPLPDGESEGPLPHNYIDALQNQLYSEFNIEVPVYFWPSPPKRLLRISTQIYNSIEQYGRLAQALKSTKL